MKRPASSSGTFALLLTLGCSGTVEIGYGTSGAGAGGSATTPSKKPPASLPDAAGAPSSDSAGVAGTTASNDAGGAATNGTAGTPSNGTAGVPGGTVTTGACSHLTSAPPAPPKAGSKTFGPCDIYAEDGAACVAAHSTVRALYGTYDGPLYQVRRTSDGATLDILPRAPGGIASAATQDAFCGTDDCTISVIYDQSGQGNHLTKAPAGGAKPTPDNEADAKAVVATWGGQKVYGVHIIPGVGYRDNSACGTATGDDAETVYAVVAGDSYNSGCCFDYGNMERNSRDNGEGSMEAVYFGNCTIWGKGAANGPWVMGDLENGLWAGDTSPYAANTTVSFGLVTAMVKGDRAGKNHWAIKTGNAQSGVLALTFDGARPSARYNPMRKEGAIGLGTGGDNSNSGKGNFFEGVMTNHFSSAAADDSVQANIVGVYGAP